MRQHAILLAVAAALLVGSGCAAVGRTTRDVRPLCERILPAPPDGGFRMDTHFVWESSVLRGTDGVCHMLAVIWPKTPKRIDDYYPNTVIAHAIAARPEGPFKYQAVALGPDPASDWDSVSCHNPYALRYRGGYVLFYSGYNGRFNSIGYATAPSPQGPWRRQARALHPGKNPAVCVRPDGGLLLVYRGLEQGMKLFAAKADSLEGPWEFLPQPLLEHPTEDPFLWHDGREYWMLVEDNGGRYTGSRLNGAVFRSKDGVDWKPADPILGYGHPIRMSNGSPLVGRQEKPWLLLDEHNRPTHLYLVKDEGRSRFATVGRDDPAAPIWNVCIPLSAP